MKRWIACLCVLICTLSVGCQSEQVPDVVETPKTDVQTTPSNQDKKFALQKVSEILLVEDPDDLIGVIKGLRVDQDRIYLMDTSQQRIMVFTIEGQFVRAIGRQGGGPGEFRKLFSMDARDGLVACSDNARQRITLFDSSGTFLNSFDARTKESAPSGACTIITSDKTLLVCSKPVESARKQIEENRYPWTICEFDTLGNMLSHFAPYHQEVVGDKIERPLNEYKFSFAFFRIARKDITYFWRENTPIVVAYKGRQAIEKTIHVKTAFTKPDFRQEAGKMRQSQGRPTSASIRAMMERLEKNPEIKTFIYDVLFDEVHSVLIVLEKQNINRGRTTEHSYSLSLFDYDSEQNILSDTRFPDREEQPRFVSMDIDADGAIYCVENDAPDNYIIGKYRLVEEMEP